MWRMVGSPIPVGGSRKESGALLAAGPAGPYDAATESNSP